MVSHNKEIYRKDDSRIYWRTTAELKKKIKLFAIERNMTMSEVLTRAVNQYLELDKMLDKMEDKAEGKRKIGN